MRDGYQAVVILTMQGQVHTGLVRGETAEKLTLQDAEGRTHVIAKADIDERKPSGVSLMPDGLNTGLTLQDFAGPGGVPGSARRKNPSRSGICLAATR